MKYRGNPKGGIGYRGKTLTIDLTDSKSLANALNYFIGARQDVDVAAGEAIEALCAEGEKIAKSLVPVDSGELRDSITHETTSHDYRIVGTITAGTKHAMFVEFGTGVVGAQHGYIGSLTSAGGWEYDINGHGDSGWVYPKNGTFYHTRGQASKPFMYETAREISMRAKEILNEYISK